MCEYFSNQDIVEIKFQKLNNYNYHYRKHTIDFNCNRYWSFTFIRIFQWQFGADSGQFG